MASEPSLSDLISAAIESRLLDIHTAIPGAVVSYDPSTQTCVVQPVVKQASKKLETALVTRQLPVIQNVPVIFQRGSGYAITFPLLPGDAVVLLFNEASFAQWRSTGIVSEPGDVKRFALSYPVALPGLASSARALQSANSTSMVVGSDLLTSGRIEIDQTNVTEPISLGAGGTLHAAQAELVLAALNALKTTIQGWTPVANDGGAALKAALTTLFATWPTPIASKVRVLL